MAFVVALQSPQESAHQPLYNHNHRAATKTKDKQAHRDRVGEGTETKHGARWNPENKDNGPHAKSKTNFLTT